MRLRTTAATTVLALAVTTVALAGSGSASDAAHPRDEVLVTAFNNVSRSTTWTTTATIPLSFDTFHPQGMVVTKDRIFLSSVEILEPTVRFPTPVNGYDRTPGKGIGHLFVLDRAGKLLKDIRLGEGNKYHPGGIDFDGEKIWVPVAEYRPNSHANVYTVDASTYAVTKVFEANDHIGGVVHDRVTGKVVGNSWGSRRFYTWTDKGVQLDKRLNPSHFIDYQDCQYVATDRALCSGVTGMPQAPGHTGSYELGGLALLDLRTGDIEHEVPFQHWSAAGHVATRNPVDVQANGSHLTVTVAPDDSGEGNGTAILVYEADVTPLS